MTYAEQLKKPQWQKKRLEILERDKWTCQRCNDTESTLTVHHKSYRKEGGKFVDVWDYDDNDLITLCEECHQEEEDYLRDIKEIAFFQLRGFFENAPTIADMLIILHELKQKMGRRITSEDVAIISRLNDEVV